MTWIEPKKRLPSERTRDRRVRDDCVKVDFHCHSTSSDGTLAPAALAEHLAVQGLSFAALTDHDTLDGCTAFRERLAQRGIGCIDGVEITVSSVIGELHILGYGVDPVNSELREALDALRLQHDPGMKGLVDSLKHIRDRSEQVRKAPLEAAAAIRLVHAAGGIAVLAHPLSPPRDFEALAALVRDLKSAGLDGLEALYAPYSPERQAALVRLADEHGLVVSAGSDYHGPAIPGQSAAGALMSQAQWRRFRDLLLHMPGRPRANLRPLAARGKPGGFAGRVVLPTVLALALFAASTFAVIVPWFEATLLERKKEMIRELTTEMVSVAAEYEADERAGRLSREDAQAGAAARIRDVRYGREGKDYFWITDMTPKMIMHPYRVDLDGKDVGGYADANGVRVFVEFVKAVREKSEGYVEYLWQWKDDASRIVPKLSYVRRFAPWDWVVGTGIYLDDVHAEIDALARRLIWLFAAMAGLLALPLSFAVHQSLAIERRRRAAEAGLRESHEKYRALVEASTEGMVMVAAGTCLYANKVFLDMVGYLEAELSLLALSDLLAPAEDDAAGLAVFIAALSSEGSEAPAACECRLVGRSEAPRDAIISASPFEVSGRSGWILIVRDLAARRRAEAALGVHDMSALAREAPVGIFSAAWGRRGILLDANPAARAIFGIAADADMTQVGFLGLASDPAEAESMFEELAAGGALHSRELRITQPGGDRLTVEMTIVIARDAAGATRRLEGIVEDVSARRRTERRQEELIAELQTSSLYLSDAASKLARAAVYCSMETPIRRAAALMTRAGEDAILVASEAGDAVGILTDHDMRERVVAGQRIGLEAPVREIMTSPLEWITDDALLSEAVAMMRERDIGHLVVKRASGQVTGILRARDLVHLHRNTAVLVQQALEAAGSVAEVAEQRCELASLAARLLSSGARPRHVSRIVSAVSDLALERLVELAASELGPAPEGFAFLVMGSEGRQEPSGGADQDNALLFRTADAQSYFLSMGEKVCGWLDGMGVPFCKGGIMARNPAWCVPAAVWHGYFNRWIREPEPEELLDCNVFFDFRRVTGDPALSEELRAYVEELLADTPSFFLHLARDLLRRKLPPQSPRPGQAELDVKEAMAPIAGFARLYALRHGMRATNTLQRLEGLRDMGVLKPSSAEDILEAWTFLLGLRMRLTAGTSVELHGLGRIEQAALRHSLAELAMIHRRIAFDFPGAAY